MIDKNIEQKSFENSQKWQAIGFHGYFNQYYDPEHQLFWGVYHNDGWGGSWCAETQEDLDEMCEEKASQSW